MSLSCVTADISKPIVLADVSLKQPSKRDSEDNEELETQGHRNLDATLVLTAPYKLDESTVFTVFDHVGQQLAMEQTALRLIQTNLCGQTFSYQTNFVPKFWAALTGQGDV